MKKYEINEDTTIYYDIPFNEKIYDSEELGEHSINWPVTYILYNKTNQEAYVGETTNFKNRMFEHYLDERRKNFNKVLFVDYKKATKSTILNLEAFLIRGMSTSGEYFVSLQNRQSNSNKHSYYNQKKDNEMCKKVWHALKEEVKIVRHEYEEVIEKNEYKYSPFIALNENQSDVLNSIINELITKDKNRIVIKGGSGTGKTAIALQLFKRITDYTNSNGIITSDMVGEEIDKIIKINKTFSNNSKKYTIAYITPMNNFCTIIRKSIKKVSGLRRKDLERNKNYINNYDLELTRVYSGNDLTKLEKYITKNKYLFDLLIVDEAHRLSRYYNLSHGTEYSNFYKLNKKLRLKAEKDKTDGNQLDWIIKLSKNQVFFYDEKQSIRSSDIPKEYFEKVFKDRTFERELIIQERCSGGEEYINYISSIFSNNPPEDKKSFSNYRIKLFNSFSKMKEEIDKEKTSQSLLSSGYYFPKDKDMYIDNIKLNWNSTNEDWINYKKKKKNEVGCIHVLAGVDVDYLGVIIGSEIDYDESIGKLVVIKENYTDELGKKCIDTEEQLLEYILNIYYILLTRGMKGTYIYVENHNMKEYLKKYFDIV